MLSVQDVSQEYCITKLFEPYANQCTSRLDRDTKDTDVTYFSPTLAVRINSSTDLQL